MEVVLQRSFTVLQFLKQPWLVETLKEETWGKKRKKNTIKVVKS